MNANRDLLSLLGDSNPFSSRATRPGSLEYQFCGEASPASLVASLQEQNWWGEIIGPHGSGKSTLLHSLREPLAAAGRRVQQYTMHSDEKRLAISATELKSIGPETLIVVDGYEQLGGWNRSTLKKICRQQGTGLLVTAHESVGLPTLYRTSVTFDLARTLVCELLPPGSEVIRDDDVSHSMDRWKGNLREVFFELYDLYESRRVS